WIFYDLVLSPLYGLGEQVNASMIDRYALYQIAVYCDQLVSDGNGGTEPRFTCNVYIQSQADALRVVNDLASVFRGMAYWANNLIVPVADMPRDPVYTFTNANVENGVFEYTGSTLFTRKTVALVSWNDPDDFYRSKIEVVQDDDAIVRYGIRQLQVTAFGCSSRGQAQRVGLYHLYTANMETGGVGFTVGLDGVLPAPGDVVRIADKNRAGRMIGARISAAPTGGITLDRTATIQVGDSLTVSMPSGASQTRLVSAVDGRNISVSVAFSAVPQVEGVWSVDSSDLVTQQARIVGIKEVEGIRFEVSAVLHDPRK